jgi:aryl-alcohol dehydrogenase-like predicted oxidoreductase
MTYVPASDRYGRMVYNRSGRSNLRLPAVSLGLWNNFGHDHSLDGQRAMVRRAFDLGITHFDLANNYGPPYGAAEENFGTLLRRDLAPFRDELVVSTKAGYDRLTDAQIQAKIAADPAFIGAERIAQEAIHDLLHERGEPREADIGGDQRSSNAN